ncbi:MAG: hypothetical protein HC818_04960 [Synechococcaceae cyanobacterium RM1_1_27]|nr:hypothetical protein [Synechococcaceae cyanobacterium RM1_1_27]
MHVGLRLEEAEIDRVIAALDPRLHVGDQPLQPNVPDAIAGRQAQPGIEVIESIIQGLIILEGGSSCCRSDLAWK